MKNINWKEYIDNKGYKHKYANVEMLAGLMTCSECPLYSKCALKGEQDSCDEYNEKLQELKEKGIE